MELGAYEGGGAGGKLRRSPMRRAAAPTPYGRPPTAGRGGHGGIRNVLLSRLVDPALQISEKLVASTPQNMHLTSTKLSGEFDGKSSDRPAPFSFPLTSVSSTIVEPPTPTMPAPKPEVLALAKAEILAAAFNPGSKDAPTTVFSLNNSDPAGFKSDKDHVSEPELSIRNTSPLAQAEGLNLDRGDKNQKASKAFFGAQGASSASENSNLSQGTGQLSSFSSNPSFLMTGSPPFGFSSSPFGAAASSVKPFSSGSGFNFSASASSSSVGSNSSFATSDEMCVEVDMMYVDEMCVEVDMMYVDEMCVDMMYVDEMCVNVDVDVDVDVDEMDVDVMYVDVDEMCIDVDVDVDEMDVDVMYVDVDVDVDEMDVDVMYVDVDEMNVDVMYVDVDEMDVDADVMYVDVDEMCVDVDEMYVDEMCVDVDEYKT